jgi:hypothetical protein
MTDEERQNLCDRLRHLPAYMSVDGMRAADEIERLALTQFDASAGLIEAAEWHEEKAEDCEAGAKRDPCNKIPHLVSAKRHREAAKHFRARAADRSGPADYIPIGGAGNGA